MEELLKSWDELNSAIQRMLVSQPFQMTEAAARVEDARVKYNDLLWRFAYQKKD